MREVYAESLGQLTGYSLGGTWCPAVFKKDRGGYGVRILLGVSISQRYLSSRYGYYDLDDGHVITRCPRGYTKQFKGAKVVDLLDAMKKWETEE